MKPMNAKLEDFGVRGTTTPEERLKEYKAQKLKGKKWLEALDRDREVAKIVCFRRSGT